MICDPQSRNPPSHFTMTQQQHQGLFASQPQAQGQFPHLARPLFASTNSTPSPSAFSKPLQAHQHQAYTTPSSPAFAPRPQPQPQSASSSRLRPKALKKSSSSTGKHRNVQMSLEVKVEKAKGFQAFFVPLCKGGVPPAPPCSPVLGHRETQRGVSEETESAGSPDYFGAWTRDGGKEREEWVEDVEGMDVDRY
ncbi:hypothetical protein L202_02041 [Cryptococcus amylolentus CBS 6039]|uniref:Uncharacterized protein n=2 Tax=Cryptococcus amylolentus TaxID=104669 RepID=A0A1E3HZE5_9TREE|nr:hypothetical protein L202_02041 [Cryptococcus amylolentus CBS 6039]ODN81637.1 hypothetical protein L202_02041 [Cryptococcus amylolentus CBS 6039]ODO10150.1 hypothetical protein I350_02378 [Cryptococcus amylolentus CBS 6273]